MWRHSWLTRPLTITQNICPLLFDSNMIHTLQTHLQQTNSQVHEWIMQRMMVHKREASRLPNSVCARPSWQLVSATLWWCKWGMWPAACYGFWHPADTSMGLTHTFFFKLLPWHPIHRWVEVQNEIHFFLGVRATSMIMVPSMGNAKAKKNTSLADYREQKDWQESK